MQTKRHVKSILLIMLLMAGIAFILLSLLFTHHSKNQGETSKYGGVYKYAHTEDLKTLDPREAVFALAQSAIQLIFDPLVRVTEDLNLAPSICASWDMRDEGLTFVCHIREGVLFHDGGEVTSGDVVFSLNYIAKNEGLNLDTLGLANVQGIDQYWEGTADFVAGIKALDKHNVSIQLKEKCPHFPYIISSPRYVVYPINFRGQSRDDFFSHPVGTGPFKYFSLNHNTLKVIANKEYYAGRPYLDGLVLAFYPQREDAIKAFYKGEVDDLTYYFLTEPPQRVGDEVVSLKDSYSNLIVFPNNSRAPFNDETMRLILYGAINRDDVVAKCFPASRVSETIIPRGIIGYDDEVQYVSYETQSARAMIERLQKEGRVIPRATIYAVESDIGTCASDEINRYFVLLGLPWELKLTSTGNLARYFFDGSMDAEIELIGVKNEDALNVLRFFGSKDSENLARIKDETIDSLLEEVRNEHDPLKKVILYREIDRRIISENYAMPIVSPRVYSIWSNRFKHEDVATTKSIKEFTKVSLR